MNKQHLLIGFITVLLVSACSHGGFYGPDDKLVNQGAEHLRDTEFKEAEDLFNQALEVNPSNGLAHLNLGLVYQLTDRVDEAKKKYQEIIDKKMDDIISGGPLNGKQVHAVAKERLATLP